MSATDGERKTSGLRAVGAARSRNLLQDRAYEDLKHLIQVGEFAPGTFLSERRLAQKLGMSKTPIRSALVRLDLEGFVTVSPQQGIVVREAALEDMLDILDIRVPLETFVVKSVAGRLEPAQVEQLRDNIREQEAALKAGDLVTLTRLDAEFHIVLSSFLGNREIVRVMGTFRDRLHRLILRCMRGGLGRPKVAVQEHAAIAEAVIKGKGDTAADLLVKHLDFGRQFILRNSRT